MVWFHFAKMRTTHPFYILSAAGKPSSTGKSIEMCILKSAKHIVLFVPAAWKTQTLFDDKAHIVPGTVEVFFSQISWVSVGSTSQIGFALIPLSSPLRSVEVGWRPSHYGCRVWECSPPPLPGGSGAPVTLTRGLQGLPQHETINSS